MVKYIVDQTGFDDAAAVHDRNTVRERQCFRQITGDKQDARLLTGLEQQFPDIFRRGDVEQLVLLVAQRAEQRFTVP